MAEASNWAGERPDVVVGVEVSGVEVRGADAVVVVGADAVVVVVVGAAWAGTAQGPPTRQAADRQAADRQAVANAATTLCTFTRRSYDARGHAPAELWREGGPKASVRAQ